MFGTSDYQCLLIGICPLSLVLSPAFSSWRPEVNGFLPIDSKTISAVNFSSPLAEDKTTSTPFSLLFTPLANLVLTLNLRPCLVRSF